MTQIMNVVRDVALLQWSSTSHDLSVFIATSATQGTFSFFRLRSVPLMTRTQPKMQVLIMPLISFSCSHGGTMATLARESECASASRRSAPPLRILRHPCSVRKMCGCWKTLRVCVSDRNSLGPGCRDRHDGQMLFELHAHLKADMRSSCFLTDL